MLQCPNNKRKLSMLKYSKGKKMKMQHVLSVLFYGKRRTRVKKEMGGMGKGEEGEGKGEGQREGRR